ncbi:hypothetical protein HK096_001671 [Nowakowskiella sp. JEL0078]|nr:hypothetical protein HK096_001671 [Nowakowskiella sp. JEL0078]
MLTNSHPQFHSKINTGSLVGVTHLNPNQLAVLGLSQANPNFRSHTPNGQSLNSVSGYSSANMTQNLNVTTGFNYQFVSGQIDRQSFNQQTQSQNFRPNDLVRANSFPRVNDSVNGCKEKLFKDQMGTKDYSKDRGLRYPRPDLEWEPDPIPTGFDEYRKRWSDGTIATSKMEGWGPEPKVQFDPHLMWENPLAKNQTQATLGKYPDNYNTLGANTHIELKSNRIDWNDEKLKNSSWNSDSGRFNQISNSQIGNSNNLSLVFPSENVIASPVLQTSKLGNWGQNVKHQFITSSLNKTNTVVDGLPFEYSSVGVGGWNDSQSRQSCGTDIVNSTSCNIEKASRESMASSHPIGIAAPMPIGNDLWAAPELNSNRRSLSVVSKNLTENWGGSNKTHINNRFWGVNTSSQSTSPINGPLSAPAYSSFDEDYLISRQKTLRSQYSTESLNSRHQLHNIQQNIQRYQQQIQKQIRTGGISNIGLPESNMVLRHRSSMQSLGGTSGQRNQWAEEPITSQNLSWNER